MNEEIRKYNFRLLFLLLSFSLRIGCASAQPKVVPYSRDFEFKDGVYLSIADFKNNHPIDRSKIIFDSNRNDPDFLKYVLNKSTFSYLDGFGKEQKMSTNKIWGYCSNSTLYINYGTSFNRVTIIGSLSHFVAVVPTRIGYDDPFNPYPYYNYNYPYGTYPPRYVFSTNQYIMDFDTGTIVEFNVENMEALLQRDAELYKAFMDLRKRQKRDSIFLYLRKYNEKHPIYFPVG